MSDGAALECFSDGVFKVVMGWVLTLGAEGEEAIIDAAAIKLTQVSVLYAEDSCFGSGGGMSRLDESLLCIEDGVALHRVLAFMRRNDCCCIARVWEDPPKGNVTRCEFAANAIHFRDVAVGDGAVAGQEEQYDEMSILLSELRDGLAVQVHAELSGYGRSAQREKEQAAA
jgi:hypothetical protein